MIAEFNEKPAKITYKLLPTGEADVWLCKDITRMNVEYEDGSVSVVWTAEEVYFRAVITYEEVEENFDALFENGGPITDPDTGESSASGITLAERVAILEEEIKALEALEEQVAVLEEWHEESTNVAAGPEEEIIT